MFIKMLAFIFALVASPNIVASDSAGKYSVLGAGTESCGQFVSARREGNEISAIHYAGWIGGYVTAYNTILKATYDIAGRTDLGGLMLWIENYCNKHPLDSVADAAESLMIELYPRRHVRATK